MTPKAGNLNFRRRKYVKKPPQFNLLYGVLKKNFEVDKEETTLTQKIQKFYDTFKLTEDDIKERQEICKYLNDTLKTYFPDCEIIMYGSSANGIGLKRSHLDLLFIPYPGFSGKLLYSNFVPFDRTSYEDVKKLLSELPEPDAVLEGTYKQSELVKLQERLQAGFIRNILKKQKEKFSFAINTFTYPNSVLATTKESRIQCIVSLRNRLVLNTTQLLELYGKTDSRVLPLMTIICFWARSMKLSKSVQLSVYPVQLLVVFFLQNTTPSILPSLSHLHKLCGKSEVVEGCEVAILTDLSKIPQTKNTQTLGELLLQFFRYYWEFDFTQKVICPHIGRAYPIKDMKKNPFFKNFEVSDVCIQDPFNIKCNVAKPTLRREVQPGFRQFMYVAQSILNDGTNIDHDTFFQLFDLAYYNLKLHKLFEPVAMGPTFSFYLNLNYGIVTALSSSLKGAPSVKDLWYDRAPKAIFDVLKHGLLMDCDILNQVSFAVKSKVNKKVTYVKEETPKMEGEHVELLMSIQCNVDIKMSHNRSVPETDLHPDSKDFTSKVIKKEYSVTRQLIAAAPKMFKADPFFTFRCDIYKSDFTQVPDILIVLTPIKEQGNSFMPLTKFLPSYLCKNVHEMMMNL